MIAARRRMQRASRQHIRRTLDQQRKPRRPRDFGWMNGEVKALEYGDLWVRTSGAVMPEPGGWNAQSEAYKQDIFTYLAIQAYETWKYAQEHQPEKANGAATEPEYEPLDWTQYT